ncbi:MAG TPA: hypothetical protein VFS21_34790 [Roseiflexaceae bacterium]|nr:hypothetical protein [Roseiflexaceae bacterium]
MTGKRSSPWPVVVAALMVLVLVCAILPLVAGSALDLIGQSSPPPTATPEPSQTYEYDLTIPRPSPTP